MNVVAFRFDASPFIGIGHAMRCLELSRQFVLAGWKVFFVVNRVQREMEVVLTRHNAEILILPHTEIIDSKQDALDTIKLMQREHIQPIWFIVDHYSLDSHWETVISNWGPKVAAIDDLANRAHLCDALMDMNPVNDWENRYKSLVPEYCRTFLGPSYLILRPEFRAVNVSDETIPSISHVGVSYGGGDPTEETEKLLSVISRAEYSGITFEIIAGYSNSRKSQLAAICEKYKNVVFHEQIEDMASFFKRIDLFVGAGGGTLWEAFSCAVPAVVTTVAENQIQTVQYLSQFKLIWSLGWHDNVTEEYIASKLNGLLLDSTDYVSKRKAVSDFIRPVLLNDIHPLVRYILELE
ncbi:UDP-2,4-diacetamido-2,4,6-trideoxy-beta-L-altropyranose hydrolase [Paenibacillus albus]|uniref:UDP-2,4-diacetamido-2,4, 6-trideoxy-beta-L-altropyranose hydrolase n=1 Tax=Paenibacillus albus TaxID=2495582 RepID=UPI0013E0BCD9|nr:UDP-2,4-diacetamido-2,4,6-trideoxy-beta-L-altropyranose hydrolase [Paenibacillus albus]